MPLKKDSGLLWRGMGLLTDSNYHRMTLKILDEGLARGLRTREFVLPLGIYLCATAFLLNQRVNEVKCPALHFRTPPHRDLQYELNSRGASLAHEQQLPESSAASDPSAPSESLLRAIQA